MPPSAQALSPSLDAIPRVPGRAAQPAEPVPAMHFAGVAITETGSFPPSASESCWVYLTLNAEIALSLPRNPTLQALVRQPRARISVDGQWLWWALRRKYPQQALRKLSGSDLVHTLAQHCAAQGRRLLLLGSHAEANALAVMRLRHQHPSLQVAGFAPEPYRPGVDEEERAAHEAAQEAILAFEPDYVVLGLGADKEQRLCRDLAPRLDGRVQGLLCFGGAIDMLSGRVRRAPRWMQQCGLESVYRVCEQPSRLPRWLRSLKLLPLLAAGRY
jgi:N-acetylglucosaminyldiphosphoundecaprenol N-acetyl-beta-D-mannosaminyltransferase